MSEAGTSSKHEFKAEIKQLLDILVHSLYTNKDVFLRELVSNASDALEKARFESSRVSEAADPDLPLEIRISLDKDKKLLVVSDTGIGMTKEELMENIGTDRQIGFCGVFEKGEGGKRGLGKPRRTLWRGFLLCLHGCRRGRYPLPVDKGAGACCGMEIGWSGGL